MISPMMSFFALLVAIVQRYDTKAGPGKVIAALLPYQRTDELRTRDSLSKEATGSCKCKSSW